jgi:hypothetical protein
MGDIGELSLDFEGGISSTFFADEQAPSKAMIAIAHTIDFILWYSKELIDEVLL